MIVFVYTRIIRKQVIERIMITPYKQKKRVKRGFCWGDHDDSTNIRINKARL